MALLRYMYSLAFRQKSFLALPLEILQLEMQEMEHGTTSIQSMLSNTVRIVPHQVM